MKLLKYNSLIFFSLILYSIQAQNYELKTSTLNSGSETATSTNFKLNGAVGEISSGPSTSANFVLNSGSISNRVGATADPGLIVHYPLNGNLLDVSGNGFHGTADGTLEQTEDVAGIPDKAYFFDGFENKVYYIFAEPTNFTGFTVSTWVYIEDPNAATSQHIIGLESTDRLFQIVAYQGNFGFWEGDTGGSGLGYVQVGAITQGWHHLVVTWNGTVVTGYLDGVDLNSGAAPVALDFDVEEISIGSNNHFGEYLEGAVDEVKVFNYPLDFNGVQNLYNSYPPTPTAPQNLRARIIAADAIQLRWKDGNNESGYYIYYDDNGLTSFFGEAFKEINSDRHTITGLTPDTEYYFEVYAENDQGDFASSTILATPTDPGGPVAYPENFTLDETVTIQFFPQNSFPVGEMDAVSKVYLHAGLVKPEDVESNTWSTTVGNWGEDDGIGQMTLTGGVWEITINPRTYFNVSEDFIAAEMRAIFRNEDGTAIGAESYLQAIRLDIFDPTTISPIGGFLETTASTDVYLNDGGAFTPLNFQLENLTEFSMEALVNFDDTDPATEAFMALISRGFDDGAGSFTPYHGIVNYTNMDVLNFPSGLITTEVSGIDNPYIPDLVIDDYVKDTWAHVALVYTTPSSGLLEVYINGIYRGFLDVFEVPKVANMLRIGQFNGGVDELRFWSYPLTQDDIRIRMKTEIDPATSGLIGYWKMNGKTTVSGTDYIIDETSSLNDLIAGDAVITQQPDLDVISLALNPKSIAQNEMLSISYTIKNIGAANAGEFDLDFYISTDAVFDGSDVFLSNINYASGATLGESIFNIIQATIPNATTIPDGNYFVIAVLDGPGMVAEENETNNTANSALNVSASNTNNVTTSITLDNYSFPENAGSGTVVGAISYDDPDEDLFDISLVAGDGDTDNALFQVIGGELLVDAFLDFEIDKTSYEVRIQVDDNRGGVYEEPITLSLTDVNEAPTDIGLTNANIFAGVSYFENAVGTLETTDQDQSDSHTYIITEENNPDASFMISGSDLLITVNNPVLDEEYFITIQSTDSEGLTTSKELVITVVPAAVAPSGLLLSNNTINENHGPDAAIGKFFTTDEDSDTHTYSFAGGTDDASFGLTASGNLTQGVELAEGQYSIRVTTTDDTDLTFTRTFTINVIKDDVSGVVSIGGDINNYRIIGVPFTSTTISNVFQELTNEGRGTEWRILSFNGTSTTDLTGISSELNGGNGYWFISTQNVTVQLPAANLNTNATVSKSLSQGWNAVGNPFLNPLTWSTVISFNEGLGTITSGDVGEVFTWNGSWNTTTQLGIMQGGYVKAITASTGFAIPASTASIGSARTTETNRMSASYFENSSEWQVMFLLESKGISSNISGVGVNPSSIEGMDAQDIDPPPTPSVFDPLQLTEKATGLTKNLKEVSKSVMWDFALTGTGEETTLSWNQTIASQLDEPLMIALLPQGELFDMSEMGSITFNPEKNQSVMVIYGNELPKELLYNAITAYPNPAGQEVSFRFYVDGEGVIPASVELYNLGGQRLGAINQNVSGGSWAEIQYQIGSEDILKSGIYLFKVRYNDFESVVKKLIVK